MASIGIIANPASGRDIRRLVAYGTVIDNQEKINIVERLILGALAVNVDHIYIMPDSYGLGDQAICKLRHKIDTQRVSVLDMPIDGTQIDSGNAATMMESIGVKVIITMGGDGTNRAVTKGSMNIPLIPISTGTNNVFPQFIEGTVAGLVAGLMAKNSELQQGVEQHKKLDIFKNDVLVEHALVDAVTSKEIFIGSRAIWDLENVSEVFLTRAQPHNIGLSALGGFLDPLDPLESEGLRLTLGKGGGAILAPIAPGLIRKVSIEKSSRILPDQKMTICKTPGVIALDGEREVEIGRKDTASIMLNLEGPRVVNLQKVMKLSTARNLMIYDKELIQWL
ncbi:ATP-NAD kinase family protein [Tindallia californiensis]|uniref:Predicted polyphosphate-or ATP-dependent NAD kinase n=1 Tax=Tindallia californiensis TaxID=159292 RepID=A0A1H3J015_9FIRM|nr:NAD(+)/NADH kinase [Tindallia californiensis]SDY33300.1 Predicted polyphosphate-or ATP-dependent NAD kinase [Tindallia californiensis]